MFTTGSAYKDQLESIGATFVGFEGYADFTEKDIDSNWPVSD